MAKRKVTGYNPNGGGLQYAYDKKPEPTDVDATQKTMGKKEETKVPDDWYKKTQEELDKETGRKDKKEEKKVPDYWWREMQETERAKKAKAQEERNKQAVNDTFAGKYGTGKERVENYKKAGLDPDVIQKMVNADPRSKATVTPPKKEKTLPLKEVKKTTPKDDISSFKEEAVSDGSKTLAQMYADDVIKKYKGSDDERGIISEMYAATHPELAGGKEIDYSQPNAWKDQLERLNELNNQLPEKYNDLYSSFQRDIIHNAMNDRWGILKGKPKFLLSKEERAELQDLDDYMKSYEFEPTLEAGENGLPGTAKDFDDFINNVIGVDKKRYADDRAYREQIFDNYNTYRTFTETDPAEWGNMIDNYLDYQKQNGFDKLPDFLKNFAINDRARAQILEQTQKIPDIMLQEAKKGNLNIFSAIFGSHIVFDKEGNPILEKNPDGTIKVDKKGNPVFKRESNSSGADKALFILTLLFTAWQNVSRGVIAAHNGTTPTPASFTEALNAAFPNMNDLVKQLGENQKKMIDYWGERSVSRSFTNMSSDDLKAYIRDLTVNQGKSLQEAVEIVSYGANEDTLKKLVSLGYEKELANVRADTAEAEQRYDAANLKKAFQGVEYTQERLNSLLEVKRALESQKVAAKQADADALVSLVQMNRTLYAKTTQIGSSSNTNRSASQTSSTSSQHQARASVSGDIGIKIIADASANASYNYTHGSNKGNNAALSEAAASSFQSSGLDEKSIRNIRNQSAIDVKDVKAARENFIKEIDEQIRIIDEQIQFWQGQNKKQSGKVSMVNNGRDFRSVLERNGLVGRIPSRTAPYPEEKAPTVDERYNDILSRLS